VFNCIVIFRQNVFRARLAGAWTNGASALQHPDTAFVSLGSMNRPIGQVRFWICFSSMNRLQLERADFIEPGYGRFGTSSKVGRVTRPSG
jgi:hypothetical protein